MCKKHDAEGYKRTFLEIMNRGYGTMDNLRKEGEKLYESHKDIKTGDWDKESIQSLNALSLIGTVVNDIIHFGHKRCLDIMPVNNKPFISQAIKMQQEAVDLGAITCYCCKSTNPIKKEE